MSPLRNAVQKGWSEAVRSGTQDRNWLGSTPMTLAGWPPTSIRAPSNAIMLRKPGTLRSART